MSEVETKIKREKKKFTQKQLKNAVVGTVLGMGGWTASGFLIGGPIGAIGLCLGSVVVFPMINIINIISGRNSIENDILKEEFENGKNNDNKLLKDKDLKIQEQKQQIVILEKENKNLKNNKDDVNILNRIKNKKNEYEKMRLIMKENPSYVLENSNFIGELGTTEIELELLIQLYEETFGHKPLV